MKDNKILIIFFCLIIMVLTANSCANKTLLQLNFDNEFLNKDELRLISHDKIELSEDQGVNKSKAIKVTYEGYEKGSKSVMRLLKLSKKVDEATLNYSVKFSDSFNFVIGGKLLGLVPDKKIAGGQTMQPDGWSARANFKKNGGVASYIYHQNKSKKWGDGITYSQPVFTPGAYNNVSIYLKLNKPADKNNGKFEIWVDGNLVIRHDTIQFRKEIGDHTLISAFYFSTFHGGSTEKYAPKNKDGAFTNEYAWFDDIYIYDGKKIGVNTSN